MSDLTAKIMKIQTGKGTIPLSVLIAIWSVSAVTSLPGLAISPIMGKLRMIFPHTNDLEIQMLTSLPSLLIIPIVLLSGKLAVRRNKIQMLIVGLAVFFASGVLYFFAKSMVMLILISCLLGIGASLVIPLSTGLIAVYFKGKYRVKQLGISSAITNVSLVVATVLTGWLATVNWHLPFLVYTLAGVSLVLVWLFLRGGGQKAPQARAVTDGAAGAAEQAAKPAGRKPADDGATAPAQKASKMVLERPQVMRLSRLMALYFVVTYLVLVIPLNLPFLMQSYHMNSSDSGRIIAVFFLAIMFPGLFLNKVLQTFKDYTNIVAAGLMCIGLVLVPVSKAVWLIEIGAFLAGLGYGLIQPFVYEKAADVTTPDKATFALALVMSMNYLAILITPFIVDLFGLLLDVKAQVFPYILNAVFAAILLVVCWFNRQGFALGVDRSYYADDAQSDPAS